MRKLFNFQKEIIGQAQIVNKDAQGKYTSQTAEKIIAQIRKECQSKSEGVQFVVTEPKAAPSEPGKLITVIDVGSGLVVDKTDTREAIFEGFLMAIGKMKQRLRDVETELWTLQENPLVPGLQAIAEKIEKQLGEPNQTQRSNND